MVAEAAEAFRDLTGHDPDAVWCAPGRVNLIGEHTDYNDGLVLPFAIDLVATVAVGRRADGRIRCLSLAYDESVEVPVADIRPGRVSGWAAYVLGVVWAIGERGVAVPGADIVVDSAVPRGAGLSSSAALTAAVALAMDGIADAQVDPITLARVCQRAENDMVGAPVGVMDPLAALLGRDGHALFVDGRTLDVVAVALPDEPRLLLVDTGSMHTNAGGGYAERRDECRRAAASLGLVSLRDARHDDVGRIGDPVLRARAGHVVTENGRVDEVVRRLRENESYAELLTESHRSLRDDFAVSTPLLDMVVDTAVRAGASGARLTGAGFGGSVLVACAVDCIHVVTQAIRSAFEERQLAPPALRGVRPSAGARRVG